MTQIPKPAYVIEAERKAIYRMALKSIMELYSKFRPECASDEDWERICRTALDCHCQDPEVPIERLVKRYADEFEEIFIDFTISNNPL